MTIHDVLNESIKVLEEAGSPTARLDAEVLLSVVLVCDRMELIKNPDRLVNQEQLASFRTLLARRLKWEPIAYLIGCKQFWTFTLTVNKDVLIPRPDTEIIVEETLNVCRKQDSLKIRILEIGTGSGAIALALAHEISQAEIIATDISAAALSVARKNAGAYHLEGKINFLQGDLFDPVDGPFDVIVCNPPYISEEEYEKLPSGVKDYEPELALLAGKSGLEFYEKIIHQAAGYLKKNGWLLMEIGAKQESEIREMITKAAFYDSIDMRTDYAGLPRVIKARRK